jgi:hypothetical protein
MRLVLVWTWRNSGIRSGSKSCLNVMLETMVEKPHIDSPFRESSLNTVGGGAHSSNSYVPGRLETPERGFHIFHSDGD